MSNYLLAALIAFLLCVALLFLLLPLLKRKKAGQEILEYVKEHSYKSGTPTMGGIAIILAMLTAALIFGKGKFVYITLAVAFAYGVTGFLDDSIKIRYKRNLGLRPYQIIILQLSIALIVAFVVYKNELIRGDVYIPFTKNTVSLGWGVIPLVVFIFIATTNSVNLTDGLDGLAASTTLVYMAGIAAIIAIVAADADKNGLSLYVKEYQGLLTVCFATVGSLAGFLLFNCFPAKIFMGDVGSLALGGVVACVSILGRLSLYIPILGVMFATSAVSDIIQVVHYKRTKRRVFLMAPFHHHLQKKGLSETRIGFLYSTITGIVALICVLTLI